MIINKIIKKLVKKGVKPDRRKRTRKKLIITQLLDILMISDTSVIINYLQTLKKMGLFNAIMNPVSSLLEPITGVIQSAINAKTERNNIKEANKANMALSQYQYNQEIDRWNKQNEYNSPLSQMKRFKEAGLNPNLIYSQGNPGNATILPRYNAPTLRFDQRPKVDISGVYGKYQKSLQDSRNIQNTFFRTKGQGLKNNWQTLANQDYSNKLFSTWGDSFGTSLDPNSIGVQMIKNTLGKSNLELERYSTAIEQQLQAMRLKDFEEKFLNMGGNYFNPVIQFLRLFRK